MARCLNKHTGYKSITLLTPYTFIDMFLLSTRQHNTNANNKVDNAFKEYTSVNDKVNDKVRFGNVRNLCSQERQKDVRLI